MKRSIISICILLMIGCGQSKNYSKLEETFLLLPGSNPTPELLYLTHPSITKTEQLPINGESTPILWNNKILIVSSGLYFTDLESKQQIAAPHILQNFSLICAFVNNGILYVYGTTGNNEIEQSFGNSVVMTSSSDLINWSTPVSVFKFPYNMSGFNTSVTQDSNGFVMAIEFSLQGELGFYHVCFAHSTDLINWNLVGGILDRNSYAGNPTIKYDSEDQYYYVLYAKQQTPFQYVSVARSKDLTNWEHQKESLYVVASPKLAPHWEFGNKSQAPTNNSDLDLIEYNNQVHIVYDFGDQATFGGEGYAVYNGSLKDFFKLFF